jgi:localization factor PodJL
VETVPHPFTGGGQSAPFAPPPAVSFDAPPFPETMSSPEQQGFQTSADPFAPAAAAFDAAPPPFGADTAFGNTGFAAADPFAPQPPMGDSYLSAARRSARAAAAQAEAERGSRAGGFSWGAATATADPAITSRKTYIWIGVIALLAIFAIAAGAILSQRITGTSTRTVSGLFVPSERHPAETVPTRPADDILPPASATALPPAQTATPPAVKPAMQAIVPTVTKPFAAPHDVKPAPVRALPGAMAPAAPTTAKPQQQAALTPLDKLTQLANAGNAKAELVVGLKYLDGDGVVVNEADAAKWLERAAEQGMAVAQYRLGTMYERGRGVPTDAAKAVHWYQLAAQAGNRKAMHNLAVAYASGTGTAKNLAEAARWFSKAAALGLADSEFNLAVLYERGLGVPQSLLDAYKWYAIAAANGDAESKSRIDALATQLSADDRAAAQHAADSFHAQPLDARSNVAPSMSDVAG